ncbi:prepilin-type N-terminal cleavage/methylation domain-containing protein [Paenibacillus profundus]|uniref:Prepilin-type N-terminal cleavage/methylation domain-containing protein n=1 Tax=Paenibacillus profundus TaxID=1173085 RepID=A0ABS8YCB9_9BACL|nr:prepilin-type N-terminal cleavage/methylation domain-containing protein [Paenibacillus profundus]MCE5168145.1 prepilin-type N-terminal cleavage/methylation domain-containing protein [Paenibacillus profundus]
MSMTWVQERVKAARNEKGMTLIELLAVIVILGIIIGIASVVIIGQFDKARDGSDATSEKILIEAAERYVLEKNLNVPDTGTLEVQVKEMLNAGYLKTEPKKSKENKPYTKVVISRESGNTAKLNFTVE